MRRQLDNLAPHYGDFRPAELYAGSRKIAGWTWKEQSGAETTFENTYNDTASLVAKGANGFVSDWLAVDGQSTQSSTSGKNLLDPGTLSPGGIAGSGGADWRTDTRFRSGYIPVSTGVSYAYSDQSADFNLVGIHIYAEDKSWIKQVSPPTGALPDGAAFVRLSWKRPDDGAIAQAEIETFKSSCPQLEKGTSATSYEPYTGGKTSPSLDKPQAILSNVSAGTCRFPCSDARGGWWESTLDADLHGIGEYRDRLIVCPNTGKVERVQRIQKLTLDGSESWLYIGIYGQCAAVYLPKRLPETLPVTGWKQDTLCTHFPALPSYQGNNDAEGFYFYWYSDTRIALRISLDRLGCTAESAREDILSAAKAFLSAQAASGTPVTVYYPLGEPVATTLAATWTAESAAPELPTTLLDAPDAAHPFRLDESAATITVEGANLFDLTGYTVTGGYYNELRQDTERIYFSGIRNPDYPMSYRSGYYLLTACHPLAGGTYTFFWTVRFSEPDAAYVDGYRNTYYYLDGKRYALGGVYASHTALSNGDSLCRAEKSLPACDAFYIEEWMSGLAGECLNVMCLRGSYENPPAYQPYREPERRILPALYGIPDADGGWSGQDKLGVSETGAAELTRHVRRIVFDGTETEWSNWVPYNSDECYELHIFVNGITKGTPIACSHLPYVPSVWTKNVPGAASSPEEGAIHVKIPKDLFSLELPEGYAEQTGADTYGLVAEAWREWLHAQSEQGTPFTVLYPAEAPELEPFSLEPLKTHPRYTRFVVSGDSPPDMTVRARCSE